MAECGGRSRHPWCRTTGIVWRTKQLTANRGREGGGGRGGENEGWWEGRRALACFDLENLLGRVQPASLCVPRSVPGIHSLRFHSNGVTMAVGTGDGYVMLYDLRSGSRDEGGRPERNLRSTKEPPGKSETGKSEEWLNHKERRRETKAKQRLSEQIMGGGGGKEGKTRDSVQGVEGVEAPGLSIFVFPALCVTVLFSSFMYSPPRLFPSSAAALVVLCLGIPLFPFPIPFVTSALSLCLSQHPSSVPSVPCCLPAPQVTDAPTAEEPPVRATRSRYQVSRGVRLRGICRHEGSQNLADGRCPRPATGPAARQL